MDKIISFLFAPVGRKNKKRQQQRQLNHWDPESFELQNENFEQDSLPFDTWIVAAE